MSYLISKLYFSFKASVNSSHFDSNPNLSYLNLANNEWKSIDQNIFQRARNSLIQIDLSGNNLNTFNVNLFNGLDKLQYLYLGYNQINVFDRNSFRSLASLREIYLNMNKLLAIDAYWFVGLTNLQLIDMSGNPVALYFPTTLDDLCIATLNPSCQVIKD